MEVEGQKEVVVFIVDRVMSKSKSLQCCHFMHLSNSPYYLYYT
jgi:hypothetical protein